MAGFFNREMGFVHIIYHISGYGFVFAVKNGIDCRKEDRKIPGGMHVLRRDRRAPSDLRHTVELDRSAGSEELHDGGGALGYVYRLPSHHEEMSNHPALGIG